MTQRKKINRILISITGGIVALCCGFALFTLSDNEQDTPDTPVVQTTDQPATPAATTPPPPAARFDEPDVYYRTCADVRAAGAAPIRVGEPGYSRRLDRDGDGEACELL